MSIVKSSLLQSIVLEELGYLQDEEELPFLHLLVYLQDYKIVYQLTSLTIELTHITIQDTEFTFTSTGLTKPISSS